MSLWSEAPSHIVFLVNPDLALPRVPGFDRSDVEVSTLEVEFIPRERSSFFTLELARYGDEKGFPELVAFKQGNLLSSSRFVDEVIRQIPKLVFRLESSLWSLNKKYAVLARKARPFFASVLRAQRVWRVKGQRGTIPSLSLRKTFDALVERKYVTQEERTYFQLQFEDFWPRSDYEMDVRESLDETRAIALARYDSRARNVSGVVKWLMATKEILLEKQKNGSFLPFPEASLGALVDLPTFWGNVHEISEPGVFISGMEEFADAALKSQAIKKIDLSFFSGRLMDISERLGAFLGKSKVVEEVNLRFSETHSELKAFEKNLIPIVNALRENVSVKTLKMSGISLSNSCFLSIIKALGENERSKIEWLSLEVSDETGETIPPLLKLLRQKEVLRLYLDDFPDFTMTKEVRDEIEEIYKSRMRPPAPIQRRAAVQDALQQPWLPQTRSLQDFTRQRSTSSAHRLPDSQQPIQEILGPFPGMRKGILVKDEDMDFGWDMVEEIDWMEAKSKVQDVRKRKMTMIQNLSHLEEARISPHTFSALQLGIDPPQQAVPPQKWLRRTLLLRHLPRQIGRCSEHRTTSIFPPLTGASPGDAQQTKLRVTQSALDFRQMGKGRAAPGTSGQPFFASSVQGGPPQVWVRKRPSMSNLSHHVGKGSAAPGTSTQHALASAAKGELHVDKLPSSCSMLNLSGQLGDGSAIPTTSSPLAVGAVQGGDQRGKLPSTHSMLNLSGQLGDGSAIPTTSSPLAVGAVQGGDQRVWLRGSPSTPIFPPQLKKGSEQSITRSPLVVGAVQGGDQQGMLPSSRSMLNLSSQMGSESSGERAMSSQQARVREFQSIIDRLHQRGETSEGQASTSRQFVDDILDYPSEEGVGSNEGGDPDEDFPWDKNHSFFKK